MTHFKIEFDLYYITLSGLYLIYFSLIRESDSQQANPTHNMSSDSSKLYFKKFHSICNAYNAKILENIEKHPAINEEWVVTEKVHGANFSFITDGINFCVGKRTSSMSEEGSRDFYNCGDVIKNYKPKVLQLFKTIQAKYPTIRQITVYGELFGGLYPNAKGVVNPEIHRPSERPREPEIHRPSELKYQPNDHQPKQPERQPTKPIQKGVHYIPHLDFYAFDIYIWETELEPADDNGRYLDYDEAIYFLKDDFVYSRELFRGAFKKALFWSSLHKSDKTTIPAMYGLSDLPNNTREGHVIRPIKALRFEYGEFIILKDKSKRFMEKQRHSAPKPTPANNVADDKLLYAFRPLFMEYINTQRLENVASKYGELAMLMADKSQRKKIIGLFVRDIIDDFQRDTMEYSVLSINSKKVINKAISDEANIFVNRLDFN